MYLPTLSDLKKKYLRYLALKIQNNSVIRGIGMKANEIDDVELTVAVKDDTPILHVHTINAVHEFSK